MASRKLPDALTRRHLLERELDPATARRYAAAYLEADRPIDAVAFAVKAGDREGIDALREHAVETGDFFLLDLLLQTSGEEVDRACWERLAAAAETAGRVRYAQKARRRLERVGEAPRQPA